MGELITLAPGVSAWLQLPGGQGMTNAGVVVDGDGITIVDTMMVASQWDPFATAVEALGPPIRRVVLTTSHIAHVGGTSRFWMASCYATAQVSDLLDLPPNVAGYRRLMPEYASELPDDLRTRPVSHTVTDVAQLTDAVVVVPTGGQIAENLVVLVPGADIVFAGAMCCFGSTPLTFDGDPAGWADALDDLAGLAATIVPGQGAVGGEAELRDLQGYLRACVDAAGDPAAIGSGPWDQWSHRDFDEVNVERAALLARGEDRVPTSLLRRLGLS